MLLAQQADNVPCNCLRASVVDIRGGLKERGTGAGRGGTINQDCRGMKIGGWGVGKDGGERTKDEDTITITILQILSSKNPHEREASLKPLMTH